MEKVPHDNELTRRLAQMPDAPRSLFTEEPVDRRISDPRAPRLFNVVADPAESRDLAQDHPQRVERMLGEYTRWFEDVHREAEGGSRR